jgi:hypothetical protein
MKQKVINNFSPSTLLGWVLVVAASFFALSILLKAIFDFDTTWDSLAYHLPFAARLWGIVPESSLQFSVYHENRYVGFPLLGEYLQGLAWYVTGRPESANLVASLSLAAYVLFLKWYFKVPLYLSVLALLAVPVVHFHASMCYVDLLGSLAVATLLMVVFAIFIGRRAPTFADLCVATLAAAIAINTKFLLAPIAGLGLALLALKIVFPSLLAPGAIFENRGKRLTLLALILPLVLFTPLKNIWLHGNPFFPMQINVAGVALPGVQKQGSLVPLQLREMPRSQLWLYSVLELIPGSHDQYSRSNRPDHWRGGPLVQTIWTHDQFTGGSNQPDHWMGGTFGVYMLFNLLFLAFMSWRIWSPEIRIGISLFALVSLVTSLSPESHIIRYYMYWPIFLISINLVLLQTARQGKSTGRFISGNVFGTVALIAVLVVVVRTDGEYTFPTFASFDDYVKKVVDKSIVDGLAPGDKVCLLGQPFEIKYLAYAPQFWGRRDYVIKLVLWKKSDCGDYRVIENLNLY